MKCRGCVCLIGCSKNMLWHIVKACSLVLSHFYFFMLHERYWYENVWIGWSIIFLHCYIFVRNLFDVAWYVMNLPYHGRIIYFYWIDKRIVLNVVVVGEVQRVGSIWKKFLTYYLKHSFVLVRMLSACAYKFTNNWIVVLYVGML